MPKFRKFGTRSDHHINDGLNNPATCRTLVLAAMDTTSNALARIFHLLAIHPEIQQKLRDEIIQARDDGTGKLRDLEYDEVMELPYLDAVCRETLRR